MYKKSDYSTKQRTEDLLKLITEDYAASVARTALETQSQKKTKEKSCSSNNRRYF